MKQTFEAIAKKTESISGRERRHALLELQAAIHDEIAPEMNKRFTEEWELLKTSRAANIPFASADYVAMDISITAELAREHSKETRQATQELSPALA